MFSAQNFCFAQCLIPTWLCHDSLHPFFLTGSNDCSPTPVCSNNFHYGLFLTLCLYFFEFSMVSSKTVAMSCHCFFTLCLFYFHHFLFIFMFQLFMFQLVSFFITLHFFLFHPSIFSSSFVFSHFLLVTKTFLTFSVYVRFFFPSVAFFNKINISIVSCLSFFSLSVFWALENPSCGLPISTLHKKKVQNQANPFFSLSWSPIFAFFHGVPCVSCFLFHATLACR